MVPGKGGDLGAYSVLEPILTKVGAPGPGGDEHTNGVLFSDQEPHGSILDIHHRPDVTVLQAVDPDNIQVGLPEGIPVVGNIDPANVARIIKALEVIFQPEDSRPFGCVVEPDPFEHSQAVM